MNQLLATLGRGRGGDGERYQTAVYEFPDGTRSQPTPFFGIALLRWLLETRTRKAERVDRLVILGTAHSMWDALLELPEIEDSAENATALYEALADTNTEEGLRKRLEELSTTCARALGLPVLCRTIPYGRTAEEHAGILRVLADATLENTRLYIDITHGFRHLPLLQMLSAFHLAETRHCDVGGVYYGAFEMGTETGGQSIVPVVDLAFASSMIKWIRAVAVVNQAGNYRMLSNLPGMAGIGGSLKEGHFLEACNRITTAEVPARRIMEAVEEPFESPAAELFRPALAREFGWVKEESLAKQQLAEAVKALRQKNYLRAVTLLHESLITHEVDTESGENPDRYDDRDKAAERLDRSMEKVRFLRALRNAMAHGTLPTGGGIGLQVRRALKDETLFRERIRELLSIVRKKLDAPRRVEMSSERFLDRLQTSQAAEDAEPETPTGTPQPHDGCAE